MRLQESFYALSVTAIEIVTYIFLRHFLLPAII